MQDQDFEHVDADYSTAVNPHKGNRGLTRACISFDHHGLSKRAKDYGIAAVMLALLVCAMFWATLTWQLLTKG